MNILSGDDDMVRLYTELSRREMEFNTLKEETKEAGFNDRIKKEKNEIAKKMLQKN